MSNLSAEEIISAYYALKPARFHALYRMELKRHEFETTLEVELMEGDDVSKPRLLLAFTAVSEFKYAPSRFSFGLISVVSLESNQWEGIRYKVFEAEQDNEFSFSCRDFRCALVSAGVTEA